MSDNTNNNGDNPKSNFNNPDNNFNKIKNTNKRKRNHNLEMEENNKIQKDLDELKNTINKQKKRIKQLENKNKVIKELEYAVSDLYSILENYDTNYYSEEEDGDWVPSMEDMEDLSMEELKKFEKELKKNLSKMTELEKKQSEEYRNNRPKRERKNTKNTSTIGNTKSSKKTTFERDGDYIEYDEEMENVTEVEITENEMRQIKKKSKSKEDFMNKIMDKAKEKAHPELLVQRICEGKKMKPSEIKRVNKQCMKFLEWQEEEKKDVSDLEFFIDAPDKKRRQILDSLRKMRTQNIFEVPYKLRILSSAMDDYSKNIAMYKAEQLENTEPSSSEYYKLKSWLDTLLNIPWGEYTTLDVKPNQVSNYLMNGRKQMDKVIHGQDETKDIIIQIISKMISNPGKCGNVFAVYGPPGVGKTTIIKEGMSKALGLPFAFLSLGGATDSSYLDGHGYTYEGSTPGKIVDILKKTGCMNPIFYFDELDKVSDTKKGEEVANLLIHLTDPSQNSLFQDKYLGNISMDLSKSVFVFSFNDINKVNPILLDRMELIYVKGFTLEEKRVITKKYLLPDLLKTYQLYLDKGQTTPFITLDDETLDFIIRYTELNGGSHHQAKEDGVRQIKRRLEKICSQMNIIKITKGKWSSSVHSVLDNIDELKNIKKGDTITLNCEIVDKLLNIKTLEDSKPPFGMYN